MPTKYKLEAQAMEEFVIVKRAMKGRIRMELRIREVDKGGAARVTNTLEVWPKLQAGLYKRYLCKTVSAPHWLCLPLPINQWASSG